MRSTVVLIRGGGTDRYGDPIEGEGRIPLKGCIVAPRKHPLGETGERGRQGVIVGLSLYAPAGVVIRHTDRVEHNGVLYEVEGEPGVWENPFTGSRPGTEVALRRATG
jgi:hypothetical protein